MVVWELFLGIGILGSRKSVIQTVVLWPGFVQKWICQIVHLTKWSYCQLKNLQIIHNMSDWKLLIVFHFKFLITIQLCSKYEGSKMHQHHQHIWVEKLAIFYFAMISIFKQFRAKVKICIRFIKHEIWYKWPSLTFF